MASVIIRNSTGLRSADKHTYKQGWQNPLVRSPGNDKEIGEYQVMCEELDELIQKARRMYQMRREKGKDNRKKEKEKQQKRKQEIYVYLLFKHLVLWKYISPFEMDFAMENVPTEFSSFK